MVSAHHHLGVVDQVEGEEDGPRPAIHHLHVLGVRDEDHHDAKDDEAAEEAHQDTTHGRKVPFGLNMQVLKEGVISKIYDDTYLEGEKSEGHNNSRCDANSNQDSVHVIHHAYLACCHVNN